MDRLALQPSDRRALVHHYDRGRQRGPEGGAGHRLAYVALGMVIGVMVLLAMRGHTLTDLAMEVIRGAGQS